MWSWRGSPHGGSAGLDHRTSFKEALTGAEECGLEALQEAAVGALWGCEEQGCQLSDSLNSGRE